MWILSIFLSALAGIVAGFCFGVYATQSYLLDAANTNENEEETFDYAAADEGYINELRKDIKGRNRRGGNGR